MASKSSYLTIRCTPMILVSSKWGIFTRLLGHVTLQPCHAFAQPFASSPLPSILPSRFKAMLYLLSIGRIYSYLPYTLRSFLYFYPTPYAGNAPSFPGLTFRTSLCIYGFINLTNRIVHYIATLFCLRADRTSAGQFPFCFLEGRSWLLMSAVHIHNFCL